MAADDFARTAEVEFSFHSVNDEPALVDNGEYKTLYRTFGDDGSLCIYCHGDSTLPDGTLPDFSDTERPPFEKYKSRIKKVYIGEGVSTIGENTFKGYTNIERVSFFNNGGRGYSTLRTIGKGAFSGCPLNTLSADDLVITYKPENIKTQVSRLSDTDIYYNYFLFSRSGDYFSVYDPVNDRELTYGGDYGEYGEFEGFAHTPEEAGKADRPERLSCGYTATEVASGFVLSKEIALQNLSNEEFVTRMYHTFMDREPDADGLADWVNALDGGCSYAYVLNSFVLSEEFGNICKSYGIETGRYEITEARDKSRNLTAFTSRMYTKALGRAYEVEGLNYWTGRVLSGEATLDAMAHGFIFSEELNKKNLSNEAFVDTLYATFFDRPADAEGKADWLGKLDRGEYTREQVLDGFLGAEEFANLVKSFDL